MVKNNLTLATVKGSSQWCKDRVKRFCDNALVYGSSRKMMVKCYDIYYGRQRDSDYNYLTGQGDYKLPSKVRSIPIIRAFFDILQATFEDQAIETNVYAVDNDSLRDKQDEMAKRVVDGFVQRLRAKQMRVMGAMQKLQEVSAAQQQGAQADPALAMAQRQIEWISQELESSDQIIQEQLTEMKRSG